MLKQQPYYFLESLATDFIWYLSYFLCVFATDVIDTFFSSVHIVNATFIYDTHKHEYMNYRHFTGEQREGGGGV